MIIKSVLSTLSTPLPLNHEGWGFSLCFFIVNNYENISKMIHCGDPSYGDAFLHTLTVFFLHVLRNSNFHMCPSFSKPRLPS